MAFGRLGWRGTPAVRCADVVARLPGNRRPLLNTILRSNSAAYVGDCVRGFNADDQSPRVVTPYRAMIWYGRSQAASAHKCSIKRRPAGGGRRWNIDGCR